MASMGPEGTALEAVDRGDHPVHVELLQGDRECTIVWLNSQGVMSLLSRSSRVATTETAEHPAC